MKAITKAAIAEVYNCHTLIEEWFNGSKNATPELLNRLLAKFSNSFSMINPNGNQLAFKDLETFLSQMYGARVGVRIEVTKPIIIHEADNICVLQYAEIQHMADKKLHRLSTAIFVSDDAGSVLWRHLHETWHHSK